MKVYNKHGQENNLVDFNYLNRPNLLINGDFQINQRGQSVYDFSNQFGYTLDMWAITKLTLEKTNKGVKLTNNDTTRHSMYQKFNPILPNGAYTLVARITNKTGTPTDQNRPFEMFYYDSSGVQHEGTVITNTGVAILKINDDISQIAIDCPPNCTISIEYVDLFEGDIAYPHVKEDCAIALQECQSRLVVYKELVLSCIFSYTHYDYDSFCANLYLPTNFKENPNISYDAKKMRSSHGGTIYTDFTIVAKRLYGVNTIRITWKKDSGTFPDTIKDAYVYMENLVISCEPL